MPVKTWFWYPGGSIGRPGGAPRPVFHGHGPTRPLSNSPVRGGKLRKIDVALTSWKKALYKPVETWLWYPRGPFFTGTDAGGRFLTHPPGAA